MTIDMVPEALIIAVALCVAANMIDVNVTVNVVGKTGMADCQSDSPVINIEEMEAGAP